MVAHHVVIAASGGGLFGLANNVASLLGKIAALFLVLFLGGKAAALIAADRHGAAIGLVVIGLVPALFLFAPHTAETLIKDTIKMLTGGG
jgi:hypothetical protein